MWRVFRKLCLIILILSLLSACTAKRQVFETTSPTGKYKFHFEAVRRGNMFSLNSQGYNSYYSFYQENHAIFENHVFLEHEFRYRSFEDMFPYLQWVADNILRMGSKEQLTEAPHDEVKISNDTEMIVPLLIIRAAPYETFLVTNLHPRQQIQIYVPSQANQDYSWVEAAIDSQTGVRVSGGQNFRILGQQNGIAHYCLSIREREIVVSSQEFNGVETLPGDKKKITPKGCPPR